VIPRVDQILEAHDAGSRVQTHYRQERELPLGELIVELRHNKRLGTRRQAGASQLSDCLNFLI
jgi:hypothetical protein